MCVCALSVAWLVPLANYVVWRVIRHCIELVIKGIASFGYYVVKLCFLAFFTLFFAYGCHLVTHGCRLAEVLVLVELGKSFVTVFGTVVNFLVSFYACSSSTIRKFSPSQLPQNV